MAGRLKRMTGRLPPRKRGLAPQKRDLAPRKRRLDAARLRHAWLDLALRAAKRYDGVNAYRLAAAMTYYAFFSVFPASALGFAAFGFLLDANDELAAVVQRTLELNLPGLPVEEIAEARQTAILFGVAGVLFAGLGWVDCVRTSVRAIWHKQEIPGGTVRAKLLDLLALAMLSVLITALLGLLFLGSVGAEWLFDKLDVTDGFAQTAITTLTAVAGLVLNVILFVVMLSGLPRLVIPVRKLAVPVLIGAIALEIVKWIGRIYLERTEANPIYQTVVVAVGLLFFLNLLNQLTLYCAAITAESVAGEAPDRVRRRRPR